MLRERTGQFEDARTIAAEVHATGQRLWETLPGVISWIVVLSPIWLTIVNPPLGLGMVILATIYFAFRASLYGARALVTRGRVLTDGNEDWLAKLEQIQQKGLVDWRSDEILDWRACRVTLLIRAYRERNVEMLRATLESILESNWPREGGQMKNVEVLFATEEDDPFTPPIVEALAEEFAGRLRVRQIRHPEEAGTLPGPSTAMNYVGRAMYREAIREGFPPRYWIVADFDADTLFHPQYLPCLVHHYVTDPNRDRRAYQPVVLFMTDYWKAPLHSRLSAIGTSVLTLGWNRKPEIAFTGAAASLDALHTVGFWPTNSHSQDSGVEMRFRMLYGSEFKVKGLPVPLWVYPVMPKGEGETLGEKIRTYWNSARALFRQSARWREGPLDEFVEASSRGYGRIALQRLWNGLERDTITILPGYGMLAVLILAGPLALGESVQVVKMVEWIGLSMVSGLGLVVFWVILGTYSFIPGGSPEPLRRALELSLFWLVFSIYVPIFTSVAGLKTSTLYALGKRPRGHFMPTPK
jgi:hypothetical protein